VTYWLQAVAIGIGLFGIGASFSAQVLARRKEFGLLAHLGFTRRQVLGIVGAECAVWTAAGALLGLLLGPGGQRRAGQGRQSAELPLDHGPVGAVDAPRTALRRSAGRRHADRLAGRARRRIAAARAVVKEDW
jgi:hypothetical protein